MNPVRKLKVMMDKHQTINFKNNRFSNYKMLVLIF